MELISLAKRETGGVYILMDPLLYVMKPTFTQASDGISCQIFYKVAFLRDGQNGAVELKKGTKTNGSLYQVRIVLEHPDLDREPFKQEESLR